MKGLILKDIYNIRNNAKQLLLVLFFMAFCIIPSSNAYAFIVVSSIYCCFMTITTFSLDERSGFSKYAMIMPVTPQMYVLAKYIMNLIFSTLGTLFGILVFAAYTAISREFSFKSFMNCSLLGFFIALLFGSLYIPALFRFGAEQARFIMIGFSVAPTLILFLIYKIIAASHITITSQHIMVFLAISPFLLLLFMAASYSYSVRCLRAKEF